MNESGKRPVLLTTSATVKLFLVTTVLAILGLWYSPYPHDDLWIPTTAALAGFVSLKLFRLTGRRIFKTLYLPFVLIVSYMYMRRMGQFFGPSDKWLLLGQFMCVFLSISSGLTLIAKLTKVPPSFR